MPLSITKLHQGLGEPTDPIWDGTSDASIISILKKIDTNLTIHYPIKGVGGTTDPQTSTTGRYISYFLAHLGPGNQDALAAPHNLGFKFSDNENGEFYSLADTNNSSETMTFFSDPNNDYYVWIAKLVKNSLNGDERCPLVLYIRRILIAKGNAIARTYNWGFKGANYYIRYFHLNTDNPVPRITKTGFPTTYPDPSFYPKRNEWRGDTGRYDGGLGMEIPAAMGDNYNLYFYRVITKWVEEGTTPTTFPQFSF